MASTNLLVLFGPMSIRTREQIITSTHTNANIPGAFFPPINVKVPEGREALRRLINSADIVIDNFSSDFLSGLGLDYGELKESNPGLIFFLQDPLFLQC